MSQQNELISIIVPAYNAANYIEECLTSLCGQTYQNLEILVIDDGSTDSTLDKCKKFKDERVKLISQTNQGVSSARNLGISLARGEWIVFVDADDKMHSIAIEKAVSIAIQHNADTICWNCYGFNEQDRKIQFLPFSPKKEFEVEQSRMIDIIQALYGTFDTKIFYPGQMFRAVWGKLLQKSIIKEHNIIFPLNMPLGEDAAFLASYFANARKVAFIDEPWNAYRISETSAVAKYRENLTQIQYAEREIIENVFSYCKERDTVLINHYIECDRQYIKNLRKIKAGKKYFLKNMYNYIRMSKRRKLKDINIHKIQHNKLLLAWSIKHECNMLEACIAQFFK